MTMGPVRCYISNFRSLGCQEAHQEGPYPPSPGWILGGQMVPTHFLEVPGGLEVLHFKFQVSKMSESPSRRPLSTISRLDPWRANGPWRTSWKFLVASRCYISNFRSLGCQEAHQEGPYPPSPGWILGGQMVPDALPGGSWWPGGAIFQISGL